ncbi:MAG TPA: hypothetical protein VEM41_13715 [Actinomycetota bacterium]|nr:hypothetical protein [Actinomycetota bacterium]
MANDAREPRRRASGVPLAGCSILLSASAAILILVGEPVWGGAAAIAVAVLQAAAASGAQTPRGRLLWGAAGPLADAAILAPVAWVHRSSDPSVAALSLVTLGVCLVASYERARGLALGYRFGSLWGLRFARQATVGAGVIAGGSGLAATLWVALSLATVSLVARAVGVGTHRADPAAETGRGA